MIEIESRTELGPVCDEEPREGKTEDCQTKRVGSFFIMVVLAISHLAIQNNETLSRVASKPHTVRPQA